MNLRRFFFLGFLFLFVCVASNCGPIQIEQVAPDFTRPDSIQIEVGWAGLSPVSPTAASFKLIPKGEEYDVFAQYQAGGHHRTSTFNISKNFTIPASEIEVFFDFLSKMEMQKGEYEPFSEWFDDYPFYEIVIKNDTDEIVIFSESQGSDHSPWQIRNNGESYVTYTSLPIQALRYLDPYLYADNEMELVQCKATASVAGSYFSYHLYDQMLPPKKNDLMWLVPTFRAGFHDVVKGNVIDKRLKYSTHIHYKDGCEENQTVLSAPISFEFFEFGKKEFFVVVLDSFLPPAYIELGNEEADPDPDPVSMDVGHQIIQVIVFERWLDHETYSSDWLAETPILTISKLDVSDDTIEDVKIETANIVPNSSSYTLEFQLVHSSGLTDKKIYSFIQETYELESE